MTISIFCLDNPFTPSSGYQIPIYYRIKYYDFATCIVFINKADNIIPKCYDLSFFGKQVKVVELRLFYSLNIIRKFYKFFVHKLPFFGCERSVDFNRVIDEFIKDSKSIIYFEGEKFANISLDSGSSHYRILSVNDSLSLAYEEEFKYGIYQLGLKKFFRYLNYVRVVRFESQYYSRFDECQVVSSVDALYLNTLNVQINTSIHNIGVDHLFFKPVLKENMIKNEDVFLIVGNLIGGNLQYTQNFIDSVWSRYIEKYRDHRLKIVSRTLPRHWSEEFVVDNNLEILNDVESLPEEYQSCSAVISPVLKKCGMQNKILEGMSMGKVVVGYEPSFLGMSYANNGCEYLAAKNSDEFVDILLGLASNKYNKDAIGKSARGMIKRYYDWSYLIRNQQIKNSESVESSN